MIPGWVEHLLDEAIMVGRHRMVLQVPRPPEVVIHDDSADIVPQHLDITHEEQVWEYEPMRGRWLCMNGALVGIQYIPRRDRRHMQERMYEQAMRQAFGRPIGRDGRSERQSYDLVRKK